jgi:hypothetical protein
MLKSHWKIGMLSTIIWLFKNRFGLAQNIETDNQNMLTDITCILNKNV